MTATTARIELTFEFRSAQAASDFSVEVHADLALHHCVVDVVVDSRAEETAARALALTFGGREVQS
jgi:hypothetical protein